MTMTAQEAGVRAMRRIAALYRINPDDHFVQDTVRAVLASSSTERRGQRPVESGGVRLTQAQLDVMRLVARGMTNEQIAGRLFVTPDTVRTVLRNSFKALGTQDRTSAAVKCYAAGLITADDLAGDESKPAA